MRIGDHEFEVTTDRYQDGWRSHAFLPGGKQRASATCGSREEAEMDLYRQLKDEFAPMPKFDPNRNYAESVVDDLLEAMGRRGFLKRLGLGLAGAAVAPAAMAAAPAAAPVAAAPAAVPTLLVPYAFADLMRQIRDRFIDERVGGWTSPNGVFQPPVPLEQAQARWRNAEAKFADVILRGIINDPMVRQRLMGHRDITDAERYVREHPEPPAPGTRVEYEPPPPPQPPQAQEPWRENEQDRQRRMQRARERDQRANNRQQPRKAIQLWPERQPRDRDEEAPWDMESKADKIVGKMLEDEQQDAHVKAYDRVQKWDKAHGTYQKLYPMKLKAMQLFREMGMAIAYERALAHVGLKPEDVAHPIRGAQIGSTHNFKGTRQVNACSDAYCSARGKAQKGDKCAECGSVLEPKQVRYSPSDLQYKFPRHIFGVETKDGRFVWFPQPIPPQPEVTDEEPTTPSHGLNVGKHSLSLLDT